jgi:hypothetical protein
MVRRPDTAFQSSRRAKEAIEVRNEPHLKFVASLPSVISGRFGCQAAHVSYADPRFGKPERGKGKKADDVFTVPLTPQEHADQHNCNEREWWRQAGIDPTSVAWLLWNVSGDIDAGIRIITHIRTLKAPLR